MSNDNCWYKSTCNLYGEDECTEACIRYYKIKKLMNVAMIPSKLQKKHEIVTDGCEIDLEKYRELARISKNIDKFVENGNNCYIYSKHNGNGKTTWGVKLLQAYINLIWLESNFTAECAYINLTSYIGMISDKVGKNEDYDELKKIVTSAKLIIFDNMPIAPITDYQITNLLTQIDIRMSNGLSNIYTGTLNKREITTRMGVDLASRIYNGSKVIEFLSNKDWRGSFDF